MANSSISGGIKEGTLSIASGWTNGNSWVLKTGNVVDCYVEVTNGTLSSGWNTIATLPEGFRPRYYFDSIQLDNGRDTIVAAKVVYNGAIQVYKLTNTSNNLRLHLTFITDH